MRRKSIFYQDPSLPEKMGVNQAAEHAECLVVFDVTHPADVCCQVVNL